MKIRLAVPTDLPQILAIYNEGIEDRVATLEQDPKPLDYMKEWWLEHQGRYAVLVAESEDGVIGWCSLNRYSHRCAYDGVADLSVYIARDHRGRGVGSLLLQELETAARTRGIHKIVLFTFPHNGLGQGLYRKCGYREVGVFRNQGRLDGRFIDVMAMEKLL